MLDTLAGKNQRKLYVVGFSKGGRAAFQLASALTCTALVTIDASPLTDDPQAVATDISGCPMPFWAIWTGYPKEHKLVRIPDMHARIAVPEHDAGWWDDLVAPQPGAKCKSPVVMDHEPADQRHGALCTAVSMSRAPYEWLLRH
jgi:hypothetical protein